MDKITKAYYRSELETALEGDISIEDLLEKLLRIVDGAWMDGHITGYREGHVDGAECWY